MMTVIRNSTTFEKLILPNVLYKYRNWNNEEHKRILTHSEIYFAKPSDFDEQHECNLERDFASVTEEAFFNYFKGKFDGLAPDEKFREMAKERMKNSKIFDKNHQELTHQIFLNSLDETVSIFCASEYKNILNLWNTFASGQEGFCVGFNTKRMFDGTEIFGSGGQVSYYDETNPPKIRALCKNNDERAEDMMKVIFSLPAKFKNEREYRLAKSLLVNRRVKIKPEVFEEIILGPEMEEDHKKEIIKIVKTNFQHANILQADYNESLETFSFNIVK